MSARDETRHPFPAFMLIAGFAVEFRSRRLVVSEGSNSPVTNWRPGSGIIKSIFASLEPRLLRRFGLPEHGEGTLALVPDME